MFHAGCRLILCLIAFALCAAAAAAEPPSAAVDAVFTDFVRSSTPGCALGVVREGQLVVAKGYGLASLEHGVPITTSTVFDIGSTSKQFTAAAILLLEQDGKLRLDDDIRKFVPSFPDLGAKVTLRHLLHHTAGVRDYINLMSLGGFQIEDYTTDDDALAAITRQRALDFPPGSEHSYSNSGYFLLSLVVEQASGMSLPDFAAQRIFQPLGMKDTLILDDHTRVVMRRAGSYAPGERGIFALATSDWEQTGDGAVQSTVEDLAKWDQNFYQPKVGGPELIATLEEVGVLSSGEKLTYARGLVVDEYRGLRRVSHGGAWMGFRAEMMRFPGERFTAIVLCNRGDSNPSDLAVQVAELYLADRFAATPAASAAAPAAPAATATVAAEILAAHQGTYWSPRSDLIRRIELRDGKLHYVRGPGNTTELAALASDRFAMTGLPGGTTGEVSFPAAAPGAPRRMRVQVSGSPATDFQRVEPAAGDDYTAFVGTFTSSELDATYRITATPGGIALHPKRGPALPAAAVFADAFQSPPGLVRFVRENGRVVAFVLSVGRARNLRFEKAPER